MFGAEGISTAATLPPPLATKPGATVKGAADARLKDMAKEMEATFLSMLLKEMRQTLEPDGGLFPGDTGDVQGGMFDLFLGQHLAAAGGFGLAAAFDRHLRTPPHADHRPPPSGGTVAGPTGR